MRKVSKKSLFSILLTGAALCTSTVAGIGELRSDDLLVSYLEPCYHCVEQYKMDVTGTNCTFSSAMHDVAIAPALHHVDEFLLAPIYVREAANRDNATRDWMEASLEDGDLGDIRGTNFQAETLGVAILEAVSVNNTTNGGVTGSNLIADNAFGDSSGIVSLVQNTGNNVVIQSATILNVQLNQ